MRVAELEAAWKKYVEKHQGIRGYAHFDRRCDLARWLVQEYVLDPSKVAQHGFYPFLQYEKVSQKVKLVEGKVAPKIKKRPISYSCHLDRCVYQRYAFLLNLLYDEFTAEQGLDHVAVAYRDNLHLPPAAMAKEAFDKIAELGDCFVMVGDFTNFFDKLDHRYLKKQLCQLLGVHELTRDFYAIYKNITKFTTCRIKDIMALKGICGSEETGKRILDRERLVVTKEEFQKLKQCFHKNSNTYGIPQGSPISDVFANIYMMDYDKEFHNFVIDHGGKYMRYSDDTIIILPLTSEWNSAKYVEAIQNMLSHYEGLVELQMEKTKQFEYHEGKITALNEGAPNFIDYLGLRLYDAGLALRPRCLTKYHYRLRRKGAAIRKWQNNPCRRGMISYDKIYRIYGRPANKRAQGKKRNFFSYLRMVDRIVGLKHDPEAEALLHGNVKGLIRKSIKG